ncbi:MAG: HD domain-containing protein [Lentisphaerae bacterium]|nr:HD domain-containing protein [Lentisphaerota bacterium]
METKAKVLEIAQAVSRAGGRAMLVGGCVRDSLLGIPVKDYDLEIYALDSARLLAALEKVCEVDAVGMSFGVLKVKHFDIDIALPRLDSKTGRGHRGFVVEVDPHLDFSLASSRRDFTVNAIMQDALTGEIIDPWNGQKDLQNRILRHVSAAFAEDPLRVLRGMQFISRFDLTPDAETVSLCAGLSQNELVSERIAGEWEKLLLKGNFISKALNFLRDCRWVRFYPELSAIDGCPQNPVWHPEGDVWNHTLKTVDAAAKLRRNCEADDLVLMLAALCHDFGKPECTVIGSDGRITSKGHDSLTAPAEKFITSIWKRRDLPERVIPLIARHMHPWQLAEENSSDKAYRKLALYVKRLDLLADLARSDVEGIDMSDDERRIRLGKIDIFRGRCEKLAIADKVPRPLIRGRHLLKKGLTPGVGFKVLLDRCFDAQIAGEFATLEAGLEFLDKLLCEK